MSIRYNGQVATPDTIAQELHNGKVTPLQLRTATWDEGRLQTELTLTFGEYTYVCEPHLDIDTDYAWEINTDEWYCKYGFLRKGHEEYELPDNFWESEWVGDVDIKWPDAMTFYAEVEWSEVSLEDVLDKWAWIDVASVIDDVEWKDEEDDDQEV